MNDADDWWVTDLLLVVFLTGVAGAGIAFGVGGPVRILLALLLVLVLPGYALVAAIFPGTNRGAGELGRFDDEPGGLRNPLPADYELGGVERAILSVVLSIAVVPAVAAVSSFTPWGVHLGPILLGVTLLTTLFVALAAVRRLRLPAGDRFTLPLWRLVSIPTPFDTGSPLGRASRRRRMANVAAVVAALLVVSSAGFALANPPQHERFTEFYVAGGSGGGTPTGNVSDYPSTFAVGQSRTVTLGVANHEGQEVTYSVVAVLRRGGTGGSGGEVLATKTVTVADGDRQRVPMAVTPTRGGADVRLQFLLYRGDPPATPSTDSAYRVLDLHVTVSNGGTAG